MTYHFNLRRGYRGDGRWTCRMRRDDRQVMEGGGYILGTGRHIFFSVEVREARMHTDHRMVLLVL